MSLQFDQLLNTISATDTVNANIAITLTGQGASSVNIKSNAQNFVLYSEQFQQTNWTKANVTVTADAVVAPNGTTTADQLIEDTSAIAARPTYQQASVSGFGIVTFSVYAKPNNRGNIQLDVWDGGNNAAGAYFNINTGTVSSTSVAGTGFTTVGTSITSAGNGWYRCSVSVNRGATTYLYHRIQFSATYPFATYTGDGASGIYLWGAQTEVAGAPGTYIATTTSAVAYSNPAISFNGSNLIGVQSDGSLYIGPSANGALQAQRTDSTVVGGNSRGQNAVDWQTSRTSATQVANGTYSTVVGGIGNTATQYAVAGGYFNVAGGYYTVAFGQNNTASGGTSAVLSGQNNFTNAAFSVIGGGQNNGSSTQVGVYNFIGSGWGNTGTLLAAVTTQAGTLTANSTSVTLSTTNSSIKVGQMVTGTGIVGAYLTTPPTFVVSISGTALTLSQNASASGSQTLSFFTPHGVVVGGGNNQASGAYSFIGGGGDAGTSANRNVASGDWSFVGGGTKNIASGLSSVIVGGGTYSGGGVSGHVASGTGSFVGGGFGHQATGSVTTISGGDTNLANGYGSTVVGGRLGTTRGTTGLIVFPACYQPITNYYGASQAAILILARQTTDATPTVLASDNTAAGTSNQVILPNNSAYYFKGEIIAGVTGAGNTSAWTIEGAIKRGASAAATSIVGTPIINNIAYDSGASTWTVTATADTTNGGLAITVTGQASTTIRWVARINTTEMTY